MVLRAMVLLCLVMLASVLTPVVLASAQTPLVNCPVSPVPLGPVPITADGFQRGDCNGDNSLDIADIINVLGHLFGSGGFVPCNVACDFNDDGALDISDAITGLDHLFAGGSPFPPPYAMCGVDPTPDSLSCAIPSCQVTGGSGGRRAFTLQTGRVGVPYRGAMPRAFQRGVDLTIVVPNTVIQPRIELTQFGINGGSALPAGLTLNSTSGAVNGTPTQAGHFEVEIWAMTASSDAVVYNVHIAIFSTNETEIDPNPILSPPPGSTNITLDTFSYEHQLPWPVAYPLWDPTLGAPNGNCPGMTVPPSSTQTVTKQLQIFEPSAIPGALPLVIFHHGAGYAYDDYVNLLRTLSTHGVLCVSVNDTYSFQDYISYYCWGGHDEAARVMIAAKEYILSAAECPSEPLFGRVDPTNIFYAGHSRGGAAAIIAAEFDHNTRGVIALQPTDARADAFIGTTSRWVGLPRVPILNISVEQDLDVGFPGSERIFERMRGATTMVTIFGGCHGLTTDTSTAGCDSCIWSMVPPLVDDCPYINRASQQQITNNHVGAFVRRHAFGDLSLEGYLYGSNNQFSPLLSHAHKRNLGSLVIVDDFSDFPFNSMGFATTVAPSGALAVGECYEFPTGTPPMPPVSIDNLLITIPSAGSTVYTSPVGTALDPLNVSHLRRISFRIKNPDTPGQLDNFGYSWLDEFSVSLTDSLGNTAQVPVLPWLPNIAFHPQPSPPGAVTLKYQRFMTVTLPLTLFSSNSPGLNLSSLVAAEFRLSTVSNPTENVLALDDIHFE